MGHKSEAAVCRRWRTCACTAWRTGCTAACSGSAMHTSGGSWPASRQRRRRTPPSSCSRQPPFVRSTGAVGGQRGLFVQVSAITRPERQCARARQPSAGAQAAARASAAGPLCAKRSYIVMWVTMCRDMSPGVARPAASALQCDVEVSCMRASRNCVHVPPSDQPAASHAAAVGVTLGARAAAGADVLGGPLPADADAAVHLPVPGPHARHLHGWREVAVRDGPAAFPQAPCGAPGGVDRLPLLASPVTSCALPHLDAVCGCKCLGAPFA